MPTLRFGLRNKSPIDCSPAFYEELVMFYAHLIDCNRHIHLVYRPVTKVCSLIWKLQLAIFLLAFLVLTGAWLGFWVVRKLVLTEDGSVDVSTSHFVAWSIRVLAAVMILQVCSFILRIFH